MTLAAVFTLSATASARDYTVNTELTEPSELCAQRLEFVIGAIRANRSLSGLVGLGAAVEQAQEEYGVNALFILAVASHESYYGTSKAAQNRNNLFGIMQRGGGQVTYESKADSVAGFARLVSGSGYFGSGRTTLAGINGRYAPYNPEWKDKVLQLMHEYARLAGGYEPSVMILDEVSGSGVITQELSASAVITRPAPKERGAALPCPEPHSIPIRRYLTYIEHFYAEPLTKLKKRGILV